MNEEITEDIREIDHTVLTCIQNGQDDIQQITETTTLPNYKANYSFQKLQKHGLIKVHPPQQVERTINGEKHVFKVKSAELTARGREYLEQADQEDQGGYEDLSHEELVQKVHHLEQQIEDIQKNLEIFREQVKRKL